MKRKMASYLRKAPRKLGKRQKIKRSYPIVVRSNTTREFDSENWNALRSWEFGRRDSETWKLEDSRL